MYGMKLNEGIKISDRFYVQATERWIKEFVGVSHSTLEELMHNNPDRFINRTMPVSVGDTVYYCSEKYEVVKVDGIDVIIKKAVPSEEALEVEEIDNILDFCNLEKDMTVTINKSQFKIICIVNATDIEVVSIDVPQGAIEENIVNVSLSHIEDFESYLNLVKNETILSYLGTDYIYKEMRENSIIAIETEIVDFRELEDMEHYWGLPCHGMLWRVDNICDKGWILENAALVSSIGFWIIEDDEEADVYLGIDGGNYSFFDEHWVPLYKARDLQWTTYEVDKSFSDLVLSELFKSLSVDQVNQFNEIYNEIAQTANIYSDDIRNRVLDILKK